MEGCKGFAVGGTVMLLGVGGKGEHQKQLPEARTAACTSRTAAQSHVPRSEQKK